MTKSQWKVWTVVMVLFAIVFLLPMLFVVPAHSEQAASHAVVQKGPGIPGIEHIKVRAQYKVWTRDVKLTLPHTDLPQDVHIQATITTEYYYWPGRKPPYRRTGHRVTPFGVDLCYAFKGGYKPSLLWQGISADSEWFDDKEGILIQDARTHDKGTGGCRHFKVPVEHRVWLHSGKKNGLCHNPFWLAEGWVNWSHFPDQSFHWHSKRVDDSLCLWPKHDRIMTTKSGKVWRTILKTW